MYKLKHLIEQRNLSKINFGNAPQALFNLAHKNGGRAFTIKTIRPQVPNLLRDVIQTIANSNTVGTLSKYSQNHVFIISKDLKSNVNKDVRNVVVIPLTRFEMLTKTAITKDNSEETYPEYDVLETKISDIGTSPVIEETAFNKAVNDFKIWLNQNKELRQSLERVNQLTPGIEALNTPPAVGTEEEEEEEEEEGSAEEDKQDKTLTSSQYSLSGLSQKDFLNYSDQDLNNMPVTQRIAFLDLLKIVATYAPEFRNLPEAYDYLINVQDRNGPYIGTKLNIAIDFLGVVQDKLNAPGTTESISLHNNLTSTTKKRFWTKDLTTVLFGMPEVINNMTKLADVYTTSIETKNDNKSTKPPAEGAPVTLPMSKDAYLKYSDRDISKLSGKKIYAFKYLLSLVVDLPGPGQYDLMGRIFKASFNKSSPRDREVWDEDAGNYLFHCQFLEQTRPEVAAIGNLPKNKELLRNKTQSLTLDRHTKKYRRQLNSFWFKDFTIEIFSRLEANKRIQYSKVTKEHVIKLKSLIEQIQIDMKKFK